MTTREWASATIVLAFAVGVVAYPGTRGSVGAVLRAVFSRTILITLATLAAWLAGVLYVAWKLDVWNTGLIVDTALWVAASAFATVFESLKVSKDPRYFRRAALAAIGFGAAAQFVLNLYTFNYFVELTAQIVLLVLVVSQAVAQRREEAAPARPVIGFLIALVIGPMVFFGIRGLVLTWGELDQRQTMLAFAFSIWLPIAVLPYTYGLSLFQLYEKLFKQMRAGLAGPRPRWHSLVAIVLGLGGDVWAVDDLFRFRPELREITSASGYREARQAVRVYLRRRERHLGGAHLKELRLQRFAGAVGVDSEGRTLDQREMAGTRQALRWLWVCHAGHYRNGGRYRPDMLDVIGDFERHGLPDPHEIEQRIRRDGQAWYAWRRTPSGQVLAIGSDGDAAPEWLYAGAEPPRGFPGSHPDWGSDPFALPPDWTGEG